MNNIIYFCQSCGAVNYNDPTASALTHCWKCQGTSFANTFPHALTPGTAWGGNTFSYDPYRESPPAPKKVTPAGRFWILYAMVLLFAFAAFLTWCGGARAEVPKLALAHPICQTGWSITQRYDTRDKQGVIVKTVWIMRCVPLPRIIYASH